MNCWVDYIYEGVRVINIMFKSLILWPVGQGMECVKLEFKDWRGLPSVHGTIDGIHISISKPNITFAEDYYYYKIRGYSIVPHGVLDVKRRLTNIFVGLLGSINDFSVF
jgi:hypothetical protein